MSAKNFLNNLTIPSPCTADWNSMVGNDKVRFCEHCSFEVHNLSQMTRAQAERLLARSNGRLCVQYRSDAKGKPVTLPATQKLHSIGRRVSRIAAGAFTATLSVSSVVAQQIETRRFSSENPTAVIQPQWIPGATIIGTVRDPNGAVIPGATVSLWNENNSPLYTSADFDGLFRVENLTAGSYRVRVEAPGFTTQEYHVYTRSNEETRTEASLQVAAIEETVTVETEIVAEGRMGGAVAFVPPADPFIRAAQQDNLEALTELIAGRDVNRRDEVSETTALEHAVRNANREMVQLLISAGADVNAKDEAGRTVLMMLNSDATADLIGDLLNAGAKVNLKDNEDNTALMDAASLDNLEALKALIEAGAELNAQNKSGQTALMQAASEGHVNVVRALALAGADITLIDEDGMNALGLALDNDHAAVARFLKSKGAVQVVKKAKEEEE